MRVINVWAFHIDFGTLCRNAELDQRSGLSYAQGNQQGQAAGASRLARRDSLR